MATKTYISKSQDYMTPKELVEPLLNFENLTQFTTDIACSNPNIPAVRYRTINGEFEETNFVFPMSKRDGLAGEYGNGIHFCNPPWKETRKFLEKICKETKSNPSCKFWCILDANRFETNYYTDYITTNADCFWVFLPKTGFLVPEKPLDAPIPSVKAMYAYFGHDAEEKAIKFSNFIEENKIKGTVVYNYINALK